jgi:hypothetical protein
MLESLNSFANIGDINNNVFIFPYKIKSWVKENKGGVQLNKRHQSSTRF